MRPLFLTNLAAGIVFGVVLLIFAVLQILAGVRGMARGRAPRSNKYDRGSLLVVLLSGGLGVAAGAILIRRADFATIGAHLPVVRVGVFVLGILLLLGGTAFRQWAIGTLGRSFTYDVRVASGQQVISTGPYRWLRHPSYTGLIACYVGFGFVFGNWVSLAILAIVPTAGLVWRVFVEEQALRSTLGAPYEEFAATRKRLLPGVW